MKKIIKLFPLLVSTVIVSPLISSPAYPAPAKAKHRLSVADIAGDYVTTDPRSNYKTISISLIGQPSKTDGFAQADFRGKIGDFSLVGQGIILGNQSGDNDYVNFDFMFLEPQDTTLLMHSQSTMNKGVVVGLSIEEAGTSSDGRKSVPIKFRRVSHAEFLKFKSTHR